MTNELLCPHTSTCEIYKNWVTQTGKNNMGIIIETHARYDCIALDAIDDLETGIPAGQLEKKLPKNLECSHIRILNQGIKWNS